MDKRALVRYFHFLPFDHRCYSFFAFVQVKRSLWKEKRTIIRIMESFRIRSLMFSWKFLKHQKMSGQQSHLTMIFHLNEFILLLFRYLVNVSYLEIYNEEIRDLLGKDRDKSLEVIIYEKTSKLLKIVFM